MKEVLEKCLSFFETAPLESGWCCCGDKIENHNMGSGHSPVDELQYHVFNLASEIRTVLGKDEDDSPTWSEAT